MSKDIAPATPGELGVYPAGNGIRVLVIGETAWLTQRQMADLFDVTVPTINEHLATAYDEDEIEPERTIRKFRIVQQEGARSVRRLIDHYSLEAILAVGYRVRSARGTEFRQWATARLTEYLVKGFALDDERLKGNTTPADYFDELLERIRDIRASEARVYQHIRDIFAMAVDYREGEQASQRFFATMQNKMLFAATGLTAAEIIRRRADASQPNMGVNAFKGSRVLKQDVGTAKNYLGAKEIDTLNRITVMFLDQAQFRAERRQDIRLADWDGLLDKFLHDNELPVLDNAGKVKHTDALAWAHAQYDAFAERRRLEAEQVAEARYVEDLRSAAEVVKSTKPRATSAGKRTAKKSTDSKGKR